jgi:hypothetical protein
MSATPASLRSRRVLRCPEWYSARLAVRPCGAWRSFPRDHWAVCGFPTLSESTGCPTPRRVNSRSTTVVYPQVTIVSVARPKEVARESAQSF